MRFLRPSLTGTPQQVDGKPQTTELFYCKGPQANGVGEYTSEGFVVHKGSTARIGNVASIQGTSQALSTANGDGWRAGAARRQLRFHA
jgi:hypothetical protein